MTLQQPGIPLCADTGSLWQTPAGVILRVCGYADGGRMHVCDTNDGRRIHVPTELFRTFSQLT